MFVFHYIPHFCNTFNSFEIQIAKRKEKLLNYMLFLRVTPTLPNLFINLASPIVDIPFHIFFLATLLGLIPASYITVKVSLSTYSLVNQTKVAYFVVSFWSLWLIHVLALVIACPSKHLCCLFSDHFWNIIFELWHIFINIAPFGNLQGTFCYISLLVHIVEIWINSDHMVVEKSYLYRAY